ncbi:MAG: hypothetical protein M0R77_14340 [Gammaproteobacteria bacterium]|nr:hypothetical protein [Gammaproteobacteria bacterium]
MRCKQTLLVATGLSTIVLLGGCGGGGGGGEAPKDEITRAGEVRAVEVFTGRLEPATLTSTADAKTAFNQTSIVDDVPIPTLSTRSASRPQNLPQKLADYARMMDGLVRKSASRSMIRATESGTFPCDYGGDFSGTVTYAAEGRLSTGDSAVVTFNNCDDGNAVFNGKLSLRVLGASGDPSDPYASSSLTLALGALNFSATPLYSGPRIGINGGFTMASAYDAASDKETARIYGDTLLLESGSDQVLLSRFDLRAEFDGDNFLDYATEDFSISTTDSNGMIVFDTTRTFVTTYGYPLEGEMIVSGANGTIKITASQGMYVAYSDLDGDGVYEDSEPVSW